MNLTNRMRLEIAALGDLVAEGAIEQRELDGIDACYTGEHELWGVPLSVEIGFSPDAAGCLISGTSPFGSWSSAHSQQPMDCAADHTAIALAVLACVGKLLRRETFKATLAAVMADSEAAELASIVDGPQSAGNGPPRL